MACMTNLHSTAAAAQVLIVYKIIIIVIHEQSYITIKI